MPGHTIDDDPYKGVDPEVAYKTGYIEHQPEKQHSPDINAGPASWDQLGKTAEEQFGVLWNGVMDSLKTQYEVRFLTPTPKQMPETWNVEPGKRLPNKQEFKVELRDRSILNVTANYYILSKGAHGPRGKWKIDMAPLDRSQIESTIPTFKEFFTQY